MRALTLVQLSAAATCPFLFLTLQKVGSQPANQPLPTDTSPQAAETTERAKADRVSGLVASASIASPEAFATPTPSTPSLQSSRQASNPQPRLSKTPQQKLSPVPTPVIQNSVSRPETSRLNWDRLVQRSLSSSPQPPAATPPIRTTSARVAAATPTPVPSPQPAPSAADTHSNRSFPRGGVAIAATTPQPTTIPRVAVPERAAETSIDASRLPQANQATEQAPPVMKPVAASTASTVDSSPTGSAIESSYVLGPGDSLQINVFNLPEYSGQHRVLVDGSINLPVVGKLVIAGMSLKEAEDAIATRYASELRYPRITISLLQARPLRIGIAGEVKQPGFYTLSLPESGQLPSIAQAIQSAGGVTQSANLRQVEIRRPLRSGDIQKITLNLWELPQTGDLSQNLALRDGDSIMIPAAKEVNLAEIVQLSASNLATNASQVLDIALVGEVVRPGAYKLGAGTTGTTTASTTGGATGSPGGSTASRGTLTQAIQLAGGITPEADLRQIRVRRRTQTGMEQLLTLNLWQLLQSGDLSQDLILQQGDTIIVGKATALTAAEASQLASANLSPSTLRVNVIGEVQNPGSVQVASNSTLNQALLAAGGLNRRAKREAEIIRLNPNGTVARLKIEVNLDRGIDPSTNPILWNNDVIVVGRSGFAKFSDSISDVLGTVFRLLPSIQLPF